MSSTKKRCLALMATLSLALTAACAPNTGGGGNNNDDDGDGPIDLRFWTNLNVEAQASVIQAQANQCAADMDRDVSISFEAIPFDSMYTRLATAFRAGQGPDIMNTLEGAVSFTQEAGYLVPVDHIVDQHGRDDFLPAYLAAVQKDGSTWGVTDWALHQEVWYRTDLFEEAGLDIPTTWEELYAAAETLDEGPGGIRGFAVPLGSAMVAAQTYYQFLYANNVFTFDPDTGEYAFDDDMDSLIESTEFMLDLYSNFSPAESRTWAWSDFRNAFVEGNIAMVNDFGAIVGIAMEQNPDILENISAFPMPPVTADDVSGGMLGGGYYYMLGKTNESRQAVASEIVLCMMQPDLAAERVNTRPVFAIPGTHSAAESEVFLSNPVVQQFSDEIEMIREQISYRYGMEAGLNQLTGQIEAMSFFGDILQAAAGGSTSVEDAVAEINAELRRLSDN